MAIEFEAETGEENDIDVTRAKTHPKYTMGLIRLLKGAGLTFTVTFNAGEHDGDPYDSFYVEGGKGMMITIGYQPTQ